MSKNPMQVIKDAEWLPQQQLIAGEAMRTLHIHYPGWKWGIEFAANVGGVMGALIIRLCDVPTQTVYVINPVDIDIDRMRCVVEGGGMMLEAHGIRVGGARGDQIRGLKTTPAGVILPNLHAVPENNPGYDTIKAQTKLLR